MASTNSQTKFNRVSLRSAERVTLLVLGDLVASGLALLVALYFWASGDAWLEFSLEFLQQRPALWFYLLPVFWLILHVDLYEINHAADRRRTATGILLATLIGLIVYMGIFFFAVDPKSLPRRGVAAFLGSAPLLTLLWRMVYIRVFTSAQFVDRVLLVGGGDTGIALLDVINEHEQPPYKVIGVIDDDPQKLGTSINNCPVMGTSDQLMEIVSRENITELLVAISGEMQGGMFQALLDAQESGVEITRMPVAYEEIMGRVPIHHLEADWILRSFVDQARVSGFFELSKRLVDITGGLFGVVMMLLVLPLIALAIVIDSGRPILYFQIRSGRGGGLYRIIKFRTMRQDAEADGQPQWAKENDERATRVGRFLRRTHLDELPQFINVLRGEMSLVGPRAERPELVALFQKDVPFYRARLLVKPGITGWAQINYGYAVTVEDTAIKLEYDLYYIKHRNILLDFVIVLRTAGVVIGFRGR